MDKLNLAKDPNTTPETLDLLSYDEDYNVRWRVAGNPNTPPGALEGLSYDEDSEIYFLVEWNPNTPQYILDLRKFKSYLKYYG